MGKVTRGTLLATLKELKKHPRPKSCVTTAVVVQAICPQKQNNKAANLKEVIAKRREVLSGARSQSTAKTSAFMEAFDKELWDFCKVLKERRNNSNKERLSAVDSAE